MRKDRFTWNARCKAFLFLLSSNQRISRWFGVVAFVVVLLVINFSLGQKREASLQVELAQAMPPHPGLLGRIEEGEVKLPRFMADHNQANTNGIERSQFLAPNAPNLLGTINVLAVVVDFNNNQGTVSANYFDSLIFAPPVSGRGSVRDYFDEVSYSQVDIVTLNLPSSLGWQRAPRNYNYYVNRNYCTDGVYPRNCQKLAEDIVNAIDSVVDFSNYDNDGDGYAEPIMIIHAGPGAEYTGRPSDIWSHSWNMQSEQNLDGVIVYDYTIQPEYHQTVSATTSDMTIGVFVHEMGNGFWDLPDLYDRDYSSNGIGDWSLMAGGSWNGPSSDGSSPAWPDAWSRIQMGFVTPSQVSVNTTAQTIPQAYNNPTVDTVFQLDSINLESQEYYLIENRQQVSGSYDEYLPGSGLLVWHIDEAMNIRTVQNDYECTNAQCCNCSDTQHYLVKLEQADGLLDLENNTDQGDAGDPFPGSSTNRTWNNTTNPESSSWYSCDNSCVAVSNISDSGANMTADLQVRCPSLVWLGNTASWNEGSNWSGGSVPTCRDNVNIPTSINGGIFPIVDADAEAGYLTLETGAGLNMSANTLSICGDLDVQGTAQFNATGGTVVFKGNTQNINLPSDTNGQFYNLQIGDGAATQVTAGSNLSVDGNLTIMTDASLNGGTSTIQVAGNWTNGMDGFIPRNSNVVFNGTSQTVEHSMLAGPMVVFSEDFDDVTGWTVDDANGDRNPWYVSWSTLSPNSPNSGYHARYFFSVSNPANDWLYSPGISLEAGKTYTIQFNYGARSSSYPERMAVYIDTSRNTSMANQVFDNNNITNTNWQLGSGTFTPSVSGTYYLGFHAYSAADMFELAFDDVSVSYLLEPELAFYNLQVNSSINLVLADDIAVENDLTVNNNGTLNLDVYNLTVEGTLTNNGTLMQQKNVLLANGTTEFLHITDQNGSTEKYWGVDITPAGDMGQTTVIVGDVACVPGSYTIDRCYDISPTANLNATIKFWYLNSESGGLNIAGMNAYHYDGSDWNELSNISRGTQGSYEWVQGTHSGGYSPFGLSDQNPDSPTAVTLTEFSSLASFTTVQVRWQTLLELDVTGFNLYRSTSPEAEPELLSFVMAEGLGSTMPTDYQYIDRDIEPGVTYYYWLEVVGDSSEYVGPVMARADYVLFLPTILSP